MVDILHVLGSIEGRFVSAPDAFEQTLGLFCCYYGFADPSWNVLCLGVFGMRWCMFADKGRQGRVVLLDWQIGTRDAGSDPSLLHGEEVSVIVGKKFCNGRVFVMY